MLPVLDPSCGSRLSRHRRDGADEFEAGGDLVVRCHCAFEIERIRETLGQLDLHLNRLTRADHAAELDVVQSSHDRDVSRSLRNQFRNQYRTGLETGFTLQDTGEDREVRIMSLKHWQIG